MDELVEVLKTVAEQSLKNDQSILDVVKAVIARMLELEARIQLLEQK